jgi:hypothetical protein
MARGNDGQLIQPIEATVTKAGAGEAISETLAGHGLIERLYIAYTAVGAGVVTIIEEQIDGTWVEIWRSPTTNTAANYAPTMTSTKSDGTAGSAEVNLSLRSSEGWRAKVTGASTGTIKVYAFFD